MLAAVLATTLISGWFAAPAQANDGVGPTIHVFYEETDGYVSWFPSPSIYLFDDDGVRKGEVILNGEVVNTFVNNDPMFPKDYPQGPVDMTIRAYDMAGNISEYHRRVVVDQDTPTVTLAPANNTVVRGWIYASVTSIRDYSGMGSLTSAIVKGDYNVTTRKAPWRIALNTRKVADGKHAIFYAVDDKAGHSVYAERAIWVDNTAPTISLAKAPRAGKVSKTFAVTAKAADRWGVAKVQLLVNGKVVKTDTKAGYTFKINPKKYGKKFTVRLRAYDRAGNVTYTVTRTYRR
ncbi:Ig-like domain-containing protein [Actinoplanes octamycinicus]|nr:Ig-like domain-containing protein [Actinoplanes octamycinicus]